MYKSELVHIHILLVEIALYLNRETAVDVELQIHRALGVPGPAINRSKEEHEHAMKVIAELIDVAIEEQEHREPVPIEIKSAVRNRADFG